MLSESDAAVRADKVVTELRAELERCEVVVDSVLPPAAAAPATAAAANGAAAAAEGGAGVASAATALATDALSAALSAAAGLSKGDAAASSLAPALPACFPRPRSSMPGQHPHEAEHEALPTRSVSEKTKQLCLLHTKATVALKTSLTQLLLMTDTLASLERANQQSAARVELLRENARRERTLLVQTALASLSQLRSHLTVTLSGMRLLEHDGSDEGGPVPPLKLPASPVATRPSTAASSKESQWARWKREWAIKPHPKAETMVLKYTPPAAVQALSLSPRAAKLTAYGKLAGAPHESYNARPLSAPLAAFSAATASSLASNNASFLNQRRPQSEQRARGASNSGSASHAGNHSMSSSTYNRGGYGSFTNSGYNVLNEPVRLATVPRNAPPSSPAADRGPPSSPRRPPSSPQTVPEDGAPSAAPTLQLPDAAVPPLSPHGYAQPHRISGNYDAR